jgi:hypothetical protein
MSIRFGTDGWRAVIADTFTFANLRSVAGRRQFYNLEVNEHAARWKSSGFDTRFLSIVLRQKRRAYLPPIEL